MRTSLILAIATLAMLAGCSNKPMNFTSGRAGLSELDFYRARDACAAEHNVGGWFAAGPSIAVAAVAVVGEARKQNARVGYQTCMAERGFVCKDRCAVDPASITPAATAGGQVVVPASPLPTFYSNAPQVAPEPKPEPQPVVKAPANILTTPRAGNAVTPMVDGLPLYLSPARDSERLERLSKESSLLVKRTSGDWLQVATESGKVGWVVAASVTSKD